MKYQILVGLALSAFTTLPGCLVEADGGGPAPVAPDTGSLVVDWTIDGQKSPDQCDQSSSASIDVTVTSVSGAAAGEYQQACSAFATTIRLPAGSYTADAVLLDSSGSDRTTAVHLRDFDILGGDQLSVPIDFAAGSFYAQ